MIVAFLGTCPHFLRIAFARQITEYKFAIFEVPNFWENRNKNLNDQILSNEPLTTEQDLIYYDWGNHIMKLTETATRKVAETKSRAFVVIANGQRCYQGIFILNYQHQPIPTQSPYIFPPVDCRYVWLDYECNYDCPIEILAENNDNDLRNNKEIYTMLNSLGKLK